MALNTPPEALFKKVAKLASEVCRTPIAHISLIDHNRQWFKANIDLEGNVRTSRNIAFFSQALLQNEVVEIPNSKLDTRLNHNPLVTQKPSIRFYARGSIIMPSGKKVGTLCVIDQRQGVLISTQNHA